METEKQKSNPATTHGCQPQHPNENKGNKTCPGTTQAETYHITTVLQHIGLSETQEIVKEMIKI